MKYRILSISAALILSTTVAIAGEKEVSVVNTPDVVVANDAEQPVPVYVKSAPATGGDFRNKHAFNDGSIGTYSTIVFEAEEPASLVEAFQLGGVNASDTICTTGLGSCWCEPQLRTAKNLVGGSTLFETIAFVPLFSGKSDSIYVKLPRPILVSPGSVEPGAIINMYLGVQLAGDTSLTDEYCTAQVVLFTSPVE